MPYEEAATMAGKMEGGKEAERPDRYIRVLRVCSVHSVIVGDGRVMLLFPVTDVELVRSGC